MKKKTPGVLIAALVLAILVAPFLVLVAAPKAYMGLVDRAVRSASGFGLRVDELDVDFSPLAISGEGLEVLNPHTSIPGPVARAERFDLTVDIGAWWDRMPTWWTGTFEGLVVRAERNASGERNWTIPRQANSPSSSGKSDGRMANAPFRFAKLTVREARFVRTDPGGSHAVDVALLALDKQSDERLAIELDGRYEEQDFVVTGHVPLPTSERARDIDLLARMPGGDARMEGTVGHDGITPGEARFNADFENLEALADLLDQDLSGFAPLRLEGRLEAPRPGRWLIGAQGTVASTPLRLATELERGGGRLDFKSIDLTYGQSDVTGNLAVGTAERTASGELSSNVLDLDELAQWPGEKPGNEKSDEPFAALAWFAGWDLDLALEAAQLKLRDVLVKHAGLVFTGSRGRVNGTVSIEGASGEFNATLLPEKPWVASIDARADSFDGIEGFDGLPSFVDELLPLRVEVTAKSAGDGYAFEPLRIVMEESEVNGRLTVDLAGERPRVAGELRSTALEWDRVRTNRAVELALESSTSGSGGEMFTEEAIDFSWMDAAQLDLQLAADSFLYNKTAFRNISMDIQLEDGRLTIDPVKADLSEGGIRGDARITREGPGAYWRSKMVVVKLMPADLGVPDEGLIDGGQTDLLFNLESRGESTQAMASNLQGEIALETTHAVVRKDLLKWMGSDLITQLLSSINPFSEGKEQTEVECAAAYLNAQEGVLRSDERIVVETSEMVVRGDAKIDLRTEELRVDLSPSAKQGIGVGLGDLSSLVQIGGTLSDPNLQTSSKGLLKAGASIGAAIATGGISLLAQGVFDRARNSGATKCGRIFETVPETDIPEAIEPDETGTQ